MAGEAATGRAPRGLPARSFRHKVEDTLTPRLRKSPMPQPRIFETERLVLAPHGLADYEDMCTLWSDPSVTRHIGGRPSTPEEVWARLLRYAGTWALRGFGFWALRDRQTGTYLGEAGFLDLHREVQPPLGDAPELGFALLPRAQGRGIATEAVRAALDWADRAWPGGETVCMIDPANLPSLRVADKLGYRETGRGTYRGDIVALLARRAGAAPGLVPPHSGV